MGGKLRQIFEIPMDDDGEIETVLRDSDGYDVAKEEDQLLKNVFFLSESVILHCNFKKNPLRGNSERTPTTSLLRSIMSAPSIQ